MRALRWLVYHAFGVAIAFDTVMVALLGARNWV